MYSMHIQAEPTSVWFCGHEKKTSLSRNEMSRISENTMQIIKKVSARSPSSSPFWVDELVLPEQKKLKRELKR